MTEILTQQVKTPPKAGEAPKPPSRLWTEYFASAILVLLAFFLLAVFLILRPLIQNIKETNAQTAQRVQTLAGERSYLDSLSRSIAASQSIAPEALALVDRALPTEANLPLLLVQFGTAAAQTNVQIGTISFAEAAVLRSAAATSTALIPIDVSLVINAQSYTDVKRFLGDIEANVRLMDLTELASSGGESEKLLSYQIKLRTYKYGTPSPPQPL